MTISWPYRTLGVRLTIYQLRESCCKLFSLWKHALLQIQCEDVHTHDITKSFMVFSVTYIICEGPKLDA